MLLSLYITFMIFAGLFFFVGLIRKGAAWFILATAMFFTLALLAVNIETLHVVSNGTVEEVVTQSTHDTGAVVWCVAFGFFSLAFSWLAFIGILEENLKW